MHVMFWYVSYVFVFSFEVSWIHVRYILTYILDSLLS